MSLTTYALNDGVATITMDDGKVNALSRAMLKEVSEAVDQARSDGAVVVLTGRPGMFSAGFDLRVLTSGSDDALPMLMEGFALSEKLLSFPRPVIVACPGHAIAMGVFLLLSGDYRIGAEGSFRITANEVAIGMTMPRTAIEISRQRLTIPHFHRVVVTAEVFSPTSAIGAGLLDQVVPADELAQATAAAAERMKQLDARAFTGTKLRTQAGTLAAVRTAMTEDEAELRGTGFAPAS